LYFKSSNDLWKFATEFDGHTFVDTKGTVYHAHVEYAPYQHMIIPTSQTAVGGEGTSSTQNTSSSRVDPRAGTISEDPDYLNFVASLSKSSSSSTTNLPVPEPKKPLPTTTPLLEDLRAKALAKLRAFGSHDRSPSSYTTSSGQNMEENDKYQRNQSTSYSGRGRRPAQLHFAPKHVRH
jgi:hypothetical protein